MMELNGFLSQEMTQAADCQYDEDSTKADWDASSLHSGFLLRFHPVNYPELN